MKGLEASWAVILFYLYEGITSLSDRNSLYLYEGPRDL